MAAIQTTFAVMPALVYLFAGWTISRGSDTVTIGTLVAFTTLQTRLFFPIGSLLGVQLEVQSSLALFDRIFEYLDQPVDIAEGTGALQAAARGRRLRRSGSSTSTTPGRSRTSRSSRAARAARRGDRLRQDDLRLPRRAALRSHARHRLDRRRRRARPDVPVPRGGGRGGLAGDVPLPRVLRPRTSGSPKPDATDEGSRRPRAPHRSISSSPRSPRATTRSSASVATASRAGEAAHRDRPHDPPQPASPRPGRGDLGARHADRARRQGRP